VGIGEYMITTVDDTQLKEIYEFTDGFIEILEYGYRRGVSGTASVSIVKMRRWIEHIDGSESGFWLYTDLT